MVCLELLGMSRAGKTTQKQMLSERLESEGMTTATIQRPKIPFKKFKSLYHFHSHILDFFGEEIEKSSQKDVTILDRGANDRSVLLKLDYQSDSIGSQEYEELHRKLQYLIPKTDIGFLFMVSPEESLKRWDAQKKKNLDFSYLNKGLPSWDNYRNLRELHDAYSAFTSQTQIQQIDGSNSINTNFKEILRGIENAK